MNIMISLRECETEELSVSFFVIEVTFYATCEYVFSGLKLCQFTI